MGARSGSADLPLHGGKVPAWLAERMARLGRVIVEAIVLRYGRDEFLRRLGHPFWFQSFGAVMGMDWHSSGITTSVMGALRRGLAPVEWELGIHVRGGRGRHSRATPGELVQLGERLGLDGNEHARTSRLVAKVDSAAVQDGYQLYLHSFVLTDDGKWTVVQQGMNEATKIARRYHWLSESVSSFVDDPHAAIDGQPGAAIVNLADRRAARTRQVGLALVEEGPDAVIARLRELRGRGASTRGNLALPLVEPMRAVDAPSVALELLPHLQLPAHHEVTDSDVILRRLHGTLAAAAERGPKDFEALLLTPGIGARTLYSLALVAEVVHGAPCRFSDPARFSTAHGGKDGHPFPVPLRVYDETIGVLRRAVDSAKLGNDDRLHALRRLDDAARRLERTAAGPSFDDFLDEERRRSPEYDGMTVLGPAGAKPPLHTPALPRRPSPQPPAPSKNQLGLPGIGGGKWPRPRR